MAVKSEEKDNNLILTLDNGDKEKFQQLLGEWNFKDSQSLLRFAMSVMLETTDKTLTITKTDGDVKVVPADDFLNNLK